MPFEPGIDPPLSGGTDYMRQTSFYFFFDIFTLIGCQLVAVCFTGAIVQSPGRCHDGHLAQYKKVQVMISFFTRRLTMLKRMTAVQCVFFLLMIQWVLCSAVFSSPWEGHYQGTMEGSGGLLSRNAEGTWDLVLTPEGDFRLYMEIPSLMSSVLSTGTVADDGTVTGSFLLPFGDECFIAGKCTAQTPESALFQVTISGGITGTMSWILRDEGDGDGEWVFDDVRIISLNLSMSGTMVGRKVVPNPNQGYYAGIYYGSGTPGPVAGVNGEWMMSVKDDGTVTFTQTKIPVIDQVIFTGTIELDGSFVMTSDVPVVGETTCTGTFENNLLHGDFNGGITGTMDHDVSEGGSIEGTWDFTLNIPLVPWTGSGVVLGNTL